MEKNDIRTEIGARLAEMRKKKGLSMHDLAEMVHVDRGNVWRIENGKYNTGIDLIGKIAGALGCSVEIKEKKDAN